jgi:hypothetical protein
VGRCVRVAGVTAPGPANTATYDEAYAAYRMVYPALKTIA